MSNGYICRVIFNAVLAKNCSKSKELVVCEAGAGRGPEKPALAPKASSG